MALFELLVLAFVTLTGWLVIKRQTRRASIELVAPTWRRLSSTHGWRFIDGRIGVDSRMEGSFSGHDFTAVALIEDGVVELSVSRLYPSSDESTELVRRIPSFAGEHFLEALKELVAQAEELDLAGEATWQTLARQHGLRLSSRGGERTLRGEIDGHSVRIGTASEPSETVIRVRIGAPWSDRVLIVPRAEGRTGQSTGNPILDSTVTVTGGAGIQLHDPEVAGDLLAVLHPFPRSSVVGGHVQMHCPGRLEAELSERLQDALTLAKRLQSVAR